jgi:hypothetical protein
MDLDAQAVEELIRRAGITKNFNLVGVDRRSAAVASS